MTEDSLLNGINNEGLSKSHNAKENKFFGGTSQTILENLGSLLLKNPNCLIIHAGINDLTNGKDTFLNVTRNASRKKLQKPSHA